MSQALVILGTGGSAYDVLDIVEAINANRPTWRVAGFLDDARPKGSVPLLEEYHPALSQSERVRRGFVW